MATIRSLKEVRKQYKEKALEATQVSAGPQPSPPVSECDFYSTATECKLLALLLHMLAFRWPERSLALDTVP